MRARVMTRTGPLVVTEPSDGVVALWLDRPAKRNAIDGALLEALEAALASSAGRVVVLGTSDPRCFSAGADLDLGDAERAAVSDRLYALYRRMVLLPAPIVVAVEGPAVGGGAQLAIAGDLRVGGPNASLRFAGPGHGIAVGAWGLPSLIGRGRAIDLCLTMRAVAADEALRIGLLDRLAGDARAAALGIAAGLEALDRDALARVKAIIRTAAGTLAALDEERELNRSWTGAVAGPRPGARR